MIWTPCLPKTAAVLQWVQGLGVLSSLLTCPIYDSNRSIIPALLFWFPPGEQSQVQGEGVWVVIRIERLAKGLSIVTVQLDWRRQPSVLLKGPGRATRSPKTFRGNWEEASPGSRETVRHPTFAGLEGRLGGV